MSGKVGRPLKVLPYPEHEPPASILSKSGFAKFLGVPPRAVSEWLARGLLSLALTDDDRLDVETALEGLEASGILSRDIVAPPTVPDGALGVPDGTLSTEEAERLDANLKAHLRMLDVKRRRGELVDRAASERLFFEAGRGLRDSFGGWPVRVAAVVAAELGTDPARTLAILEREMRAHLASLPEPRIDWAAGAAR
jgi:hypothetical protein